MRLFGDVLIAHVAGAIVVGAVEGVRLGSPAIAIALIGVFAITGAIAGATVLATEAIAARLPAWARPLVRALPVLAIAIPVAATLFHGALAATLPGASIMPFALPVVVWTATAGAIDVGGRLLRRGRRVAIALAIALALGAGVLWLVNRFMFRSGYPDLHAGITLGELVMLGVAIRLAADAGRARAVIRIAVAAGATLAGAAALLGGLGDAGDRKLLATRGDDGRHLVRVWRDALDFDGDGSSWVLGGGDCAEGDAAINPSAYDVPGNGVDEDCSGDDATPPPPVPPPPSAASLAEWRATPEVRAILDRTRTMNVMVVSIDALRADQLAETSPGRGDFPRLTRFLDGATWFTRGLAPAAGTDICLGTLVTGRWNPYQNVAITLNEAVRDGGRKTTFVVPREVLRYVGDVLLGRGIDDVDRVITDRAKRDIADLMSAKLTTDRMLAAIAKAGDQPYFVWGHYFDLHEHHQLPVDDAMIARLNTRGTNEVTARYRALLAHVDDEFGRLLDRVAAAGHADDTIVILFSDHGENLGDDPRLPDHHGTVVYQALTHVPVAIRIPGVAPAKVADPVGLIDLTPTVLGLLGAEGAMGPLDGIDLAPLILGAPKTLVPAGRVFVMHETDQWGVVEWPHKLLLRPADNVLELYDLENDPGERRDLASTRPELVDRLRARFAMFPEVHLDRTPKGRQWRENKSRRP